MKISNNNKVLEIASSLFDNIGDANYKISISSDKNCCKDTSTKVLSISDLQGGSQIFLNKSSYFANKDVSMTSFTIKNTNNNNEFSFYPTSGSNVIGTNSLDIINQYNTWKLLNDDLKNTTITIIANSNNYTITITGLKLGFIISDSNMSFIGNNNFKGEITNNDTFYPFSIVGDGIYSFTIESEYLPTGSKVIEKNCIAVLDDIKCLIPNVLIKNKNSLAHLLYQSIIDVQDCNCMCEDMCDIYNSLYEEVRWN